MDGQTQLQQLARAAIREGRVPRERPARPWGGSGNGSRCPICRTVISTQELAYELEFARSFESGEAKTCSVHARCFRAWDAARLEATPANVTYETRETTESPG
jgi:hypothetical protein